VDGERELVEAVRRLVDAYRARCLWFLPEGFYPESAEQILRALEHIERHGDVRAFQEAARLRRWLSQTSSAPSAA
jgi:hypothetical protein